MSKETAPAAPLFQKFNHLEGRRVTWVDRAGRQHSGVMREVVSRNGCLDGVWTWLPDLTDLKEQSVSVPAETEASAVPLRQFVTAGV